MRAHEFIVEFKDLTDITKIKKPASLLPPPNASPIKKLKKPKKSKKKTITPARHHGSTPTPKVGNTQGWFNAR